jgi:hypothetical protein
VAKGRDLQWSSDKAAALMKEWPESWAGERADVPVGRALVAIMHTFMTRLQQQELSSKTLRRHLDNLWLIGGEIIREINYHPASRKNPLSCSSSKPSNTTRLPWSVISPKPNRPPLMRQLENCSSSSRPRSPQQVPSGFRWFLIGFSPIDSVEDPKKRAPGPIWPVRPGPGVETVDECPLSSSSRPWREP